jgi:hypothetical protein
VRCQYVHTTLGGGPSNLRTALKSRDSLLDAAPLSGTRGGGTDANSHELDIADAEMYFVGGGGGICFSTVTLLKRILSMTPSIRTK